MEAIHNYLAEEKMISKGYIRYAIPTTIALIFSQIAPLVDSYCISVVWGETALSAMSTVNPVYYFFNIISFLAGIGGGIGIAKAAGSGDKYMGGRVFTKVMIWMSAITLVLSALSLIFIDSILCALSTTPDNYEYAKEYLMVLLAGMVFYVNNMALTYILTDDNDANISMAGGIVSGVVNAVIDIVGIVLLHQGVWVAALGTVVGMLSGCLVFLLHMRKKDRICRFTKKRKGVEDARLIKIISPGIPEACQNLLFVVQILQSNYILSASIGTSGLGNSAVIENLELIATIIIAGISESSLPMFASYYGEGNIDEVRMIKKKVILFGEVLIIPFVVSLLIYPQWLMHCFSIDEPLMLETLPRGIRIMALAQLAAMINAILVSYMQSTDNEKKASISFFVQGIVQIAVMVVLAGVVPNDAPWIAACAAYVSVTVYFVVFCKQIRDIVNLEQKHILLMRGGIPDENELDKWYNDAKEHITEADSKILLEKLMVPYMNAVKNGARYASSFMIIQKEDGHKSAILRYDSGNDVLSEDGVLKDDEEEEAEAIVGECVRSEFNYVRRWMINFE